MANLDNKMGVYGLPGTFPTELVRETLNGFDPFIKQGKLPEWSRDAVNSLYFHYKSGIADEEIPGYHQDEEKVLEYMVNKSSLEEKFIKQFFKALEYLVGKQELDPIYLEIKPPTNAPTEQIKKSAKDVIEASQNAWSMFKWTGIGVLTLAGLYYVGPWIRKFAKSKKR